MHVRARNSAVVAERDWTAVANNQSICRLYKLTMRYRRTRAFPVYWRIRTQRGGAASRKRPSVGRQGQDAATGGNKKGDDGDGDGGVLTIAYQHDIHQTRRRPARPVVVAVCLSDATRDKFASASTRSGLSVNFGDAQTARRLHRPALSPFQAGFLHDIDNTTRSAAHINRSAAAIPLTLSTCRAWIYIAYR